MSMVVRVREGFCPGQLGLKLNSEPVTKTSTRHLVYHLFLFFKNTLLVLV